MLLLLGGNLMKKLILLFVLIASASTYASGNTFNVTCEANNFRVSYSDPDFKDYSKFYFELKVDPASGAIEATEWAGFVASGDYHGVFKGAGMPETPYQRAAKYKNHYRFMDVDAEYTFGSESGMWGYFVINKDVVAAAAGDKVDGHYVLQAGDHFGGTIDYECTKAWW